jgi:glycosyltransferase involved in cell wall biosynthesis
MHATLPWELVVADFASDDANLAEMAPGKLVQVNSQWFNRSKGLNTAAAAAKYAKLFFIDVDMLVPQTFVSIIDTQVQPGQCYFPICYSLHKDKPPIISHDSKDPNKANGWWRKEGCGMAGFCKSDFDALGGWDEGIGKSYGKEDGELYRRSITLTRIRTKQPGLFHVWHPTSQSFREGYHQVQRKLKPRKPK